MSDRPNLTPRQREFCRQYVKLGNAGKAMIAAGYSEKGARQEGFKLLKQPHIIEEIERLRSSIKQAVVSYVAAAGGGSNGKPPPNGHAPLDGDILPPEAQAEAKAEADVILTRVFIVERLMRNARICMGEEKVRTTRVMKVKGGAPDDYVAVQTETFERDAAGANRALELLGQELDRLDALRQPGAIDDPAAPAIGRNPELKTALERFTAAASKRGIHVNGHANGATNGKGH